MRTHVRLMPIFLFLSIVALGVTLSACSGPATRSDNSDTPGAATTAAPASASASNPQAYTGVLALDKGACPADPEHLPQVQPLSIFTMFLGAVLTNYVIDPLAKWAGDGIKSDIGQYSATIDNADTMTTHVLLSGSSQAGFQCIRFYAPNTADPRDHKSADFYLMAKVVPATVGGNFTAFQVVPVYVYLGKSYAHDNTRASVQVVTTMTMTSNDSHGNTWNWVAPIEVNDLTPKADPVTSFNDMTSFPTGAMPNFGSADKTVMGTVQVHVIEKSDGYYPNLLGVLNSVIQCTDTLLDDAVGDAIAKSAFDNSIEKNKCIQALVGAPSGASNSGSSGTN